MKNNDCVAIIMCVWKRPERFEKTLNMLLNQKNKNFILYIWNNNIKIKNIINDISSKYINNIVINIKHSNVNIGGIGRFYFARDIMNKHEKIIFIDDDQDFNDQMVNYFIKQYDVNAVKSRWAFIFGDKYSSRKRIFDYNIDVGYCGTGGMILPSFIFENDIIFNIPKKYGFIEDLWLSYIVNHYLNMRLLSIGDSDDYIFQVVDNKDQSTKQMVPLKNEFLKYLRTIGGWDIGFKL